VTGNGYTGGPTFAIQDLVLAKSTAGLNTVVVTTPPADTTLTRRQSLSFFSVMWPRQIHLGQLR